MNPVLLPIRRWLSALAALFSGAYKPAKNERVGVIVCGANTLLGTFNGLFPTA